MEKIHVVLAADEKYVQHMGVTIASILDNVKSNNSVVINVVDNELSEKSCSMLREIVGKYNASISFVHDNSTSLDNLYIWCYNMSKVTYYRLLIPDLIPKEVDKAIYIDSDIVVRHDITELWNTDISEYYAGIVEDLGFEHFHLKTQIRNNLGMPENVPYFNAGVMLINVKKWREDGITEKALEFHSKNPKKIFFLDQDALNAVIWGKWLSLHPKWNVQQYAFHRYYDRNMRKSLSPDFIEAVENPAVVHFTTSNKPWKSTCTAPFAEEYFKYIKMTPWKNCRQSTFNIFIRNMSHYFNGTRVLLKNHSEFPGTGPEPRENDIFTKYSMEDVEKFNPYGLSVQEYLLYLGNQSLQKYDITKAQDIEQFKKIVFELSKNYKGNDIFFSPKHYLVKL